MIKPGDSVSLPEDFKEMIKKISENTPKIKDVGFDSIV